MSPLTGGRDVLGGEAVASDRRYKADPMVYL